MQQKIITNHLLNRNFSNQQKSRTQQHYEHLSAVFLGGGSLGMLLGLLLLFIFDATDKTNAVLKYRGLAVIFTAALMLGCGAHFMDKLDDERQQTRKRRIAQLERQKLS